MSIADELIRERIEVGAALIELPNDITLEQNLDPRLQAMRAQLKAVE